MTLSKPLNEIRKSFYTYFLKGELAVLPTFGKDCCSSVSSKHITKALIYDPLAIKVNSAHPFNAHTFHINMQQNEI